MATTNKDFVIKQGLRVLGENASVNGSDLITASTLVDGQHVGLSATYDVDTKALVLTVDADNAALEAIAEALVAGTNVDDASYVGGDDTNITVTYLPEITGSADPADDRVSSIRLEAAPGYTDEDARAALSVVLTSALRYDEVTGEFDFALATAGGLETVDGTEEILDGDGNGTGDFKQELAVKAGNGISVDADGVTVNLDDNSGLAVGVDGLSVKLKADSGVDVDADGLSVKIEADKGISVGASGLALVGGSGIVVDEDGISVNVGNGLEIDTDAVKIKLNTDSGLDLVADGISVKTGAGITKDSDGIKLDTPGNGLELDVAGKMSIDDTVVVTLTGTQELEDKTLGAGTVLGADLDAAEFKITNLPTPQDAGDAVNKAYVDGVAEGLHIHASVKALATENIDLDTFTVSAGGFSSSPGTLVNGDADADLKVITMGPPALYGKVGDGNIITTTLPTLFMDLAVGDKIVVTDDTGILPDLFVEEILGTLVDGSYAIRVSNAGATTLPSLGGGNGAFPVEFKLEAYVASASTPIDGVSVAVGDRILLNNQTNKIENGIYVVAEDLTLARAEDYDTATEIQSGDFVFVSGGTSYGQSGWVQVNTVGVVDTDEVEFTQFSGAGAYTNGTGLNLEGTEFSVDTTSIATRTYVDTEIADAVEEAFTSASSPSFSNADLSGTDFGSGNDFAAANVNMDFNTPAFVEMLDGNTKAKFRLTVADSEAAGYIGDCLLGANGGSGDLRWIAGTDYSGMTNLAAPYLDGSFTMTQSWLDSNTPAIFEFVVNVNGLVSSSSLTWPEDLSTVTFLLYGTPDGVEPQAPIAKPFGVEVGISSGSLLTIDDLVTKTSIGLADGGITVTSVTADSITGDLTGSVDVDGGTITNLSDPTNDQDAATKKYVDDNLIEISDALKVVDPELQIIPDNPGDFTTDFINVIDPFAEDDNEAPVQIVQYDDVNGTLTVKTGAPLPALESNRKLYFGTITDGVSTFETVETIANYDPDDIVNPVTWEINADDVYNYLRINLANLLGPSWKDVVYSTVFALARLQGGLSKVTNNFGVVEVESTLDVTTLATQDDIDAAVQDIVDSYLNSTDGSTVVELKDYVDAAVSTGDVEATPAYAAVNIADAAKVSATDTTLTFATSPDPQTAQTVFEWPKVDFQAAELIVKVVSSYGDPAVTHTEISKLLVTTNATQASVTEYGVVSTNGSLLDALGVVLEGNNVIVKATPKYDGTIVTVVGTLLV